jgi:hypothetical protein
MRLVVSLVIGASLVSLLGLLVARLRQEPDEPDLVERLQALGWPVKREASGPSQHQRSR